MRFAAGVALSALVILTLAASAGAYTLPPDPSQNLPLGPLPDQCNGIERKDATCQNAAIYWLDQVRASVGMPPYALPADFTSLPVDQQFFILVNLDRTAYGLTPITGVTAALDQDALNSPGYDPTPSDPNFSSWVGTYDSLGNTETIYDDWFWNDGLGSANVDCTPSTLQGCWDHRHAVFWDVDGAAGPSAMGAAAGYYGARMIIGAGNASYQPTYSYTWTQAQADGAGSNAYVAPATVSISVDIVGPGEVSGCESPGCTLHIPVNSVVTLTATPGMPGDSGADIHFTGWSGACSGTSPACTITAAQANTSVTANFGSSPTSSKGGSGSSGTSTPTTAKPKTTKPKIVKIGTGRGMIHATLTGSHLVCKLSRWTGHKWGKPRSAHCGGAVTYRRLSAGRYRLTVGSGKLSVSRTVRLRHGQPVPQQKTRRRGTHR